MTPRLAAPIGLALGLATAAAVVLAGAAPSDGALVGVPVGVALGFAWLRGARAALARLLLVAAGAAAAAGLGEAGADLLLPPPPAVMRLPERGVNVPVNNYDACEVLLAPLPAEPASRPAGRVTLHLGDSMVYGLGVSRAEAFPAVLGRLEAGSVQINAGVPGMSVDYHLLHLRRWLAATHVDRVVLYLYVGNDLVELDQDMPCCAMEPLLRYDGGRPSPRCPGATRGGPLARLRAREPSHLLRRAAAHSALAAHLLARLATPAGAGEPERLERFAAVVRAIRDESVRAGARFDAVLLPPRYALEVDDARAAAARDDRAWMLDLLRRLGVPTRDAWELFAAAVRRDGSAAWFNTRIANDVHFNAAGHALLADWLRAAPASR